MTDFVNHPPHYQFPGGVQVSDITKHLNFCRGNAIKYIARAGRKGGPENTVEDLRKAAWYIQCEIERIENE